MILCIPRCYRGAVPTDDGPVTPPPPGPSSVRDAVLGWIVHGSSSPGDLLTTTELARRTGATPATAADVLRELVDLGVAHPAPGGVVIARPTPRDMADTDEVRHILEEVAVRRFVAQATDTQVGALRRALAAVERVAGAPDASLEQLVRARDWFFVVVLRSAAGVATADLLRTLRPHAGLVMSLAVAGPGRDAEIVEELREIYRALAARDAEAAIAACDRHRRNSTDAGLRSLQGKR
jgi:DNA-binding GntR family transcriptional regulator